MIYSCYECRNPFENGELVGVEGENNYHVIHDSFRLDKMPFDCLRKRFQRGVHAGIIMSDLMVYFNGKLYELSELSKLPNANELGIELNKQRTGHILKGSLEGLSQNQPSSKET